MSISDELMLKYYELLSDITLDKLRILKEEIRNGSVHPRDAKVNFAKEIITRFHSKEAADAAHENFDKMFRDKEVPEDIEVVTIKKSKTGTWLPKLLATIGMVTSTSEGKRMVQQGGVHINGVKVISEEITLDAVNELTIKVGKRKFKKVILS
jgi:tyrosyl-tRNA synthetase